MKTEILHGVHPVREALRAGRREVHRLFLSRESASPHAIATLAGQKNIPVEKVSPDRIQSMTRTDKHQGLCALVDAYPLTPETELVNTLGGTEAPAFFLLIDSVLDPHVPNCQPHKADRISPVVRNFFFKTEHKIFR